MKSQIKYFYLLNFLLFLTACGAGSISTDPGLGVTNVEATEEASNGDTAVITLSWTPPTTYTNNEQMNDLSGYKIYFGTSSDNLDFLADVGSNLTSTVIENDLRLVKGNTYYFGITAYNSINIESAMSEVIMVELAQ